MDTLFARRNDSYAGKTVLVPYLDNVMNGKQGVAIFSYVFDPASLANYPSNIREVNVLLIVQASEPDPQTQQFRTIKLRGQAVRINPND